MTSDEQLDYDNYRDAKTTIQQQNVAETNERVKRTLTVPQFVLGLFVSCCLTAVLTGVFQWKVGYKLSKFFGLVASDTPSAGEMYQLISAQNIKDEHERELAKKYHAIKNDIIEGKDEQIEKLNADIEKEQKQKQLMRRENRGLQADNKKLVDQISADKMMEEALSVIALNIVPLNLQKYIGVAHDDQWIWFVNLACDRNSYHVVNTVRNIPKLMAIKAVSERIADYEHESKFMKKVQSRIFSYNLKTSKKTTAK
jgi:hypothetical protein